MQVQIVVSLKNKFIQQEISKFIGAAEGRIAGKDAIQVQPVFGTDLCHARPKGRNVYRVHDDKAAVDICGL